MSEELLALFVWNPKLGKWCVRRTSQFSTTHCRKLMLGGRIPGQKDLLLPENVCPQCLDSLRQDGLKRWPSPAYSDKLRLRDHFHDSHGYAVYLK